jgi:hypothetical protein
MLHRRTLADTVLMARRTGRLLMALRVTRMRCMEHPQVRTVTMSLPPTAHRRTHTVLRRVLMALLRPTGHPAEQRSPHMEHPLYTVMAAAPVHHRRMIQARSTLRQPRCLMGFPVVSPRLTTPAGLRLQEAQRPTAEPRGRPLLTGCRSPRAIRVRRAATVSRQSPARGPSIRAALRQVTVK